jgi:hypothetical protein
MRCLLLLAIYQYYYFLFFKKSNHSWRGISILWQEVNLILLKIGIVRQYTRFFLLKQKEKVLYLSSLRHLIRNFK